MLLLLLYVKFLRSPGVHSPRIWVGVCSCVSETPTLNKGKLLVKSIPLFRAHFWSKVYPYLGHTFGEK